MKILVFFTALFGAITAAAAGGAHGDDHIPVDMLVRQAANLGILVIAGVIFLRKSMIEAFAARREDYLKRAEKTKAALKEAEAALADIKTKLSELESGEQKSVENAKKEAELVRQNLIKDAQAAAEKMKKEAELVIGNELAKAKAEINKAILNQAMSAAADKIAGAANKNISAQEGGFVKQLEQVRP